MGLQLRENLGSVCNFHRVWDPLVIFNRRIISLQRTDGTLDCTFNAKSAVDFVERSSNKDHARVAARPKKRKLGGGGSTEKGKLIAS